jgi:hypothetical protein
MQRFMNILGVGRVKALELLSSGYKTIDQVKEAVESGKLSLGDQYIGDDIQEDLVRNEGRLLRLSQTPSICAFPLLKSL